MTSVQTKKGAGGKEEDRQQILRQMKVRTKLKTDKSWIQHQSSEEEADGAKSPQLKSLSEARKSLWSPTPDSKPDRNSGFFSASEVFASSSVSPVQSANKRFSYNSAESYTPPSPTSKMSPPPSAAGSKPVTSYIIRGQTLNAVSQVKSPPSYNGYQKSVVQGRTNSLPRIQTATGYKMSTEEYKKLAPYNVRNRSEDLSDDEVPFTPQEQAKRTEQASNVLRSTTSKERSYVVSAAKRDSGVGTQESSAPFVAKRVEIQEEISPERKTQSLPKQLANYLYEDANRFENSWKETQSKQTPAQTSPPRVTERSSSPRASSYGAITGIDGRRSPVRPDAGRITASKEESKDTSKLPAEGTTTTHIRTIIIESKEISKPPAEKESPKNTRTTRTERVEITENKSETQPHSLESFLYEDANRYESSWKSNQANPPTLLSTSSRVSDHPESPKLITRSTEKRASPIKPQPGKITVLRDESDKVAPKPTEDRTSIRTIITTAESENEADIPKLTSYREITETRSSSMQTGPGKITVLKEESNREPPKGTSQSSASTSSTTTRTAETRVESDTVDFPKLTSCSISKTLTEGAAPIMQTGPGKISLIRDESAPPIPVPRGETKPREAASDKTGELISWSDLDNSDSRLLKEKPAAAPKPVPRSINRESERVAFDAPLIVSSPDLHSDRAAQPPAPASISTVYETRDRVPEILDESKPIPRSNLEKVTSDAPLIVTSPDLQDNRITSDQNNSNVRIKIETLSELPTTPEPPKVERSSSPRPTPRSGESTTTTTVTESRHRGPENLEDTMLEASPARSSSRTTVTTTRSTDPVYTEYAEDRDARSTRTTSREKITTTTTTTMESRYDHAAYQDSTHYDPQSGSNKGVLFVKEIVNTSENLKSPTTAGNLPDFSGDSEIVSHSTNSSYLYNSAPRRADEGPCTYCGREIKDCAKIILEHLNIYCHEYCFKCGICNKPMGDLMDNLFIHREVVHCESCYEKLF